MNNQTNNSRPLIPVNPKGLEEIAKALLERVEEKKGEELGSVDIPDSEKENYMILEGREHNGTKKYEYGDLFVSLHRVGISPSIERIKSSLGFAPLDLGNSSSGGGDDDDYNDNYKFNHIPLPLSISNNKLSSQILFIKVG